MKKTYSELLRDPRWQKKRLEILSLDNWQCRNCSSKDNMLHVHHLAYRKDAMPWEYDNDALVTLCEQCHTDVKNVNWRQAFVDLNFTEYDLLDLAIMLQFRKKKDKERSADYYEKHKVRQLYAYMLYHLIEDDEEMKEFYSEFRQQKIDLYHG